MYYTDSSEIIDFKTLLLQTDCDNIDYENVCLISKLPLNDTKITLMCGHNFNYKCIYDDVINQKYTYDVVNQKYTYNRRLTTMLKTQIQCPYCRKYQDKLLYFNDLPEVSKIKWVNYPNKYCFYPSKCYHIFKSGKRKNEICNSLCIKTYCNKHIKQYKI